jgi:hypothetical protein
MGPAEVPARRNLWRNDWRGKARARFCSETQWISMTIKPFDFASPFCGSVSTILLMSWRRARWRSRRLLSLVSWTVTSCSKINMPYQNVVTPTTLQVPPLARHGVPWSLYHLNKNCLVLVPTLIAEKIMPFSNGESRMKSPQDPMHPFVISSRLRHGR